MQIGIMNVIRSHRHEVFTETINKVALKSIKNMNPGNIPFNALIVVPTTCPEFIHNMTYDNFGDLDKDLLILTPLQDQIDVSNWLKLIRFSYEGTNTLIILDDCCAEEEEKGHDLTVREVPSSL